MSDETNTDQNDTGGIAQLRQRFEEQAKQIAALTERNAELEASKRTSDVASALKAKGLDESRATSLAKFYSGEDASEEAVGNWLSENAAAFGVTPGAQTTTATTAPNGDPNVAAAQAVQQAAFGSTTPTNPPSNAPIVVGDPAELQRLYEGAASIEQLQAMGLLPKNLSPTRGALDDWGKR